MYVVDSLMYAMGDPFTVDYQLGVCCTFAVGTKGHGRPWLRSCGHNMEFGCAILAPSISGAGKVSLTTVCQWGDRRANCTGMYGGLFWFSRSALWHNSSNIGYIVIVYIHMSISN